ncbi:MAG: CvpA family protein [Pseudomonadota bacterium]
MAWFDIALIALLALSTIFAFFRGFVTEALHLAALGGAIIATVIGFPYVEPWLAQKIGAPFIVKIAGNVLSFILALFILRLAANFIGGRIRQSEIGIFDRSLGAVFGAVRGLLIVVFFYILFVRLWQPDHSPEFIREARMGGVVVAIAGALDPYLDGDRLQRLLDRARDVLPAPPRADEDSPPPGKSASAPPARPAADQGRDAGYTAIERKAMDRAVEKALDQVLDRMRGEEEAAGEETRRKP